MSTVVKDLGAATAYGYAVEKGYTGTEAEFAELMADYAEVGQRAEDAADRAEAALDEFTSVTADATTLPEGSSATAEYSDGHLTLGIPKGDKGDTGATGDGAVYAVIGNMASVIPAGTDGYLERAYTITIPVTFYSGKDNVTGSVTSSDLYISRTSGGSGEMDTVPGSTYRNVKTATIIYAIPAGWKVGNGRITLTVTIGTVTLTYYHAYTTAPTGPQGEQGIQGPIGATPNLTIGTVTTLQPTAPATATISGTADNPVLSFGIPKGDTGEVSQDQFDAALALKADVSELLKAFPTDSAQGAIASFTDGAELPLKSLTVDIEPVQEGIGDPSPDNVRPISGWSEVNVSHSGADMTNPTVINIQLGQTVYGGTLDVVSGVLTVDRAMVDLGTLTWYKVPTTSGKWRFQATKSDIKIATSGGVIPNMICEIYKTISPDNTYVGVTGISNNINIHIIFICDLSISDVTTLVNAINGKKVVYPLATPLTISLTPHEVTALLGSNNIWADSGDSAVEYRADPTLYIQRLTEPDADMVADANIVSGQYFMVGNTLYKATANIASGATISPNVNCTRKSLSEALNELNV